MLSFMLFSGLIKRSDDKNCLKKLMFFASISCFNIMKYDEYDEYDVRVNS